MAAKLIKQLTLTQGDNELTLETWDDGTVSLGIEDKHGGAYNNGSYEFIELTAPEQDHRAGGVAGPLCPRGRRGR